MHAVQYCTPLTGRDPGDIELRAGIGSAGVIDDSCSEITVDELHIAAVIAEHELSIGFRYRPSQQDAGDKLLKGAPLQRRVGQRRDVLSGHDRVNSERSSYPHDLVIQCRATVGQTRVLTAVEDELELVDDHQKTRHAVPQGPVRLQVADMRRF